MEVEWAAGRLSVEAHDEPLCAVLVEIARHVGATAVCGRDSQAKVTVRFTDRSLAEGLGLVLRGRSYLLFGRPVVSRMIVVDAEPVATPRPASIRPAATRAPGSVKTSAELDAVFADPDPAARGAVLELAATLPAATALGIFERALADPDPSVRLSSVQLLGRRSDPASRALLATALGDSNEAVRVVAGELARRAAR